MDIQVWRYKIRQIRVTSTATMRSSVCVENSKVVLEKNIFAQDPRRRRNFLNYEVNEAVSCILGHSRLEMALHRLFALEI